MSALLQYLSFGGWLILPNMSLRSVHIVARVRISFCYKAEPGVVVTAVIPALGRLRQEIWSSRQAWAA
jgi:hypothetical protein